mgnify:CR=1 FL=1
MFKHIPNILTIMRFIFIPIILNFIFQGNYILGIIVFTISGLTDVLDGFIARKFNFVSNCTCRMYHFNDDSFLFLIYYIGSCFKGLTFIEFSLYKVR